jgi:hypothetical protein
MQDYGAAIGSVNVVLSERMNLALPLGPSSFRLDLPEDFTLSQQ